jgi:hypothetical protein
MQCQRTIFVLYSVKGSKMSPRLFETVAPEAAQAEVVKGSCAAFGFGRDVVNGEVVSGQVSVREAVFAQVSGAAADALAQRG